MLDTSLFGQSPAGPHLENALLHALCAVLVFLLLDALTGRAGARRGGGGALRGAPAARRVGGLDLGAQGPPVRAVRPARGAGVDPLGARREPARVRGGAGLHGAGPAREADAGVAAAPAARARLLAARAAARRRGSWSRSCRSPRSRSASSLVTLRAQTTAMQIAPSLAERLANACVALWQTLAQGFVPVGLAPLYPHPGQWPLAEVALAAGGRAGACRRSPLALRRSRAVPRVGLVLVRVRARADPRPGAGRLPVARRPLRVPAADRCRLGGGVGRGGSARARPGPARGRPRARRGRGARARPRDPRAARLLDERSRALAAGRRRDRPQLLRGDGARHRAHRARALRRGAAALRALARDPAATGRAARRTTASRSTCPGDTAAAVPHFERSLELDPNPTGDSEVHLYYARALADAGRPAEAVAQYETQLALSPDDRGALMGLAELRATEPAPPLRDGAEALRAGEARLHARGLRLPGGDRRPGARVRGGRRSRRWPRSSRRRASSARGRSTRQESLARLERHLAVFQAGRAVTEPER